MSGRPETGGLAGLLRERVMVSRPVGTRDAQGGTSGMTQDMGLVWAGCVPDGDGRWRVAMRPVDVAVGDRLVRTRMELRVTRVLRDPRMADRVTVYAEELE